MVTNRVYKVLVTSGTDGASIAALTAGQYIVTKKDGTKVTAASTLAPEDEVQVVVATADGSRIASDFIRVKDITAYNKEDYRAKVEQVVTVAVGTPVGGHDYNIVVINKSDKEILQHRQDKRTYTATALEGETATSLATKLRARINGDPDAIVVASGTGGNVILTAKSIASVGNAVGEFPQQYVFEVFAQDVDNAGFGYFSSFGTVTNTTAPDFGSGNFWQIRKLEQRGSGYITGITNKTLFPVGDPLYNSVVGTNYDVFVLENDDEHDTNAVSVGKFKAPISTIIAVTAGASDGIEAILDKIATS